jgi:hypothetical protein
MLEVADSLEVFDPETKYGPPFGGRSADSALLVTSHHSILWRSLELMLLLEYPPAPVT